MAFHRVLPLAELWRGELRGISVDGVKVVLTRPEEEVYALEDRCAHLGLPLHDGSLEGTVLTCRHHLYQYDTCTGQGIRPRVACIRRFPVRIQDGDVWVDPKPEATDGA